MYLLFVSVMPICKPVTHDRLVFLLALSSNKCQHIFIVFFRSLEGGQFYGKKYFERFCRIIIDVLFILMLSERTIAIFLKII